jgi:3-dehydroquinate dehydratase II
MPVRILVINGPNLNMLGKRDAAHYGQSNMADIEAKCQRLAGELDVTVDCYQSNHEGAIIDHIQAESPTAAGIIINPGALAHYGYSLHDALVDSCLPVIEVHLSNIQNRESWRRHSVTAAACIEVITGLKEESYYQGLRTLVKHIREAAG